MFIIKYNNQKLSVRNVADFVRETNYHNGSDKSLPPFQKSFTLPLKLLAYAQPFETINDDNDDFACICETASKHLATINLRTEELSQILQNTKLQCFTIIVHDASVVSKDGVYLGGVIKEYLKIRKWNTFKLLG